MGLFLCNNHSVVNKNRIKIYKNNCLFIIVLRTFPPIFDKFFLRFPLGGYVQFDKTVCIIARLCDQPHAMDGFVREIRLTR